MRSGHEASMGVMEGGNYAEMRISELHDRNHALLKVVEIV